MNEEKTSKWNALRGDGGTRIFPKEKLVELKSDFEQMCKDAGESVNDRRKLAEDTRYCRWAGQSADGKKHRDAMEDEEPFPFEGASDARVRTADEITREQIIIVMAAIMRMNLGFKGAEHTDAERVASLNTLWTWILKNQLGREWFVELTKLQQYRVGDSPAVGYLQVSWHEEEALKMIEIDEAAFMARVGEAAIAAGIALEPEDEQDLQDMLVNPERHEELADTLRALWPDMSEARAGKVADELQTIGAAAFPYPYLCESRLKVKARRLFHDIFIPDGTADLQRAPRVDVLEWVTETELREMEAKGILRPRFLEEVLKHEGRTPWRHFSHYDVNGDYSETMVERSWDEQRYKGKFALITTFFRASNADNVPGIYTVLWHSEVDFAGTEQELFDDKSYPFIDSRFELLTDNQWDSRGVAETAMTDQAMLKLLHDSFMDHAQLCTVPPLEVPASRPKLALVIRPLGQIKMNRPGEIRFMTMAQYPASNDKVWDRINERLDRFWGRMSVRNSPDWVRLYQQSLVDFALLDVAEVVRLAMRWVEKFMDPQLVLRVTGDQQLAQAFQEAQSGRGEGVLKYDVEVSFEAGMLQLDFLKAVAEMISKHVLAWDTQSTVQRDKLVRWFFGALSPTLAREMLVPVEQVNQREVEDELKNFALISAGVEPPMMTAGQNWATRLQTLLGVGEKNPEAIAKLSPTSREIYEARLKHFDGQIQQQKNAVIGQTMAEPALEAPGPLDGMA
jgi:hypothetical protein